MHSLKLTITTLLLALVGVLTPASGQIATGATYTSATEGSIGSVTFTVTGLQTSPYISSWDLSGSNFSGGALAADQEMIDFDALSNWTIALSAPTDLHLYVHYWRGYTWEFDHDFEIVSGLSEVTVLSSSSFSGGGSGILRFEDITSLTLSTSNTDNSGQLITFGVVTAVPEPSSYAVVVGLAAGALVAGTRRRRS